MSMIHFFQVNCIHRSIDLTREGLLEGECPEQRTHLCSAPWILLQPWECTARQQEDRIKFVGDFLGCIPLLPELSSKVYGMIQAPAQAGAQMLFHRCWMQQFVGSRRVCNPHAIPQDQACFRRAVHQLTFWLDMSDWQMQNELVTREIDSHPVDILQRALLGLVRVELALHPGDYHLTCIAYSIRHAIYRSCFTLNTSTTCIQKEGIRSCVSIQNGRVCWKPRLQKCSQGMLPMISRT